MAKTKIIIDGTEAGTTARILTKEYNKLNRELKDLTIGSNEYNLKLKQLLSKGEELKVHKNNVKGISNSFQEAIQNMKGMLKNFAPMALAFSVLTSAANAFFSGIMSGIKGIIEYDRALGDLKAVTGATADQMKVFEQKSIELSSQYGKSAADIVTAIKLAGSARPELLKNARAMADLTEKAIILSQASGDDVPTSIANLTSTLSAFNEPASKAGKVMDTLANASQIGVQEIPYLTEAFGKFGGVAKQTGVGIATSAAALEILGKKIKEPSTAGTNMRGILIKMQVSAQESGRAFSGFTNELDLLGDKVKDVTYLKEKYGEENLLAIQTLIAEREELKKLETQYDKTGTTQKMADANSHTMGESIERLTTSFMNQFLVLKKGGDGFIKTLDFLAQNMSTIFSLIGKGIKTFIAYKVAMAAMNAATFVSNGGLKDLASNFFKVSKAAEDGGKSTKGFGSALKSVGWAAITAMAVELGTEIWNIASGAAQAEEALKKLEQMKSIAGKNAGGRVDARQEKLMKDIAALERQAAIDIAKNGKNTIAINAKLLKDKQALIDATAKQSKYDLDAVSQRKKGYIADREAAVKELEALKAKMGTTLFETQRMQGQMAEDMYGIADVTPVGKLINKIATLDARIGGTGEKIGIYSSELSSATEESKNLAAETEVVIHQTKEQEKAAKKAAEAYEKLRGELAELIKATEQLQHSADYDARLNAYEDGLNKELFVLQDTIEKKYAAEIAKARELMKEKGEIGVEAAKQYNALLLIEDQDYAQQRQLLVDKYAKEEKAAKYEAQKQANLEAITQETSLQDAIIELKVLHAQAAANAALTKSQEEQNRANAILRAALEEQLEHDKKRRLEALMDQFDDNMINAEELKLRKEQLEFEHLAKIEEMNKQASKKLMEIDEQRINKVTEKMETAFGFINQLNKIQANKENNAIKAKQKAELDALDAQLANKEITQQEYDDKKKIMDEENRKELGKAQLEQAEKERKVAIFQAIIQATLAAAKSFASLPFPLGLVPAGLALAQGYLNVQAIKNEPLPQYADGGYSDVIGKKDGLRYRAKHIGKLRGGMTPNFPATALISEKGGEYFVPHHLMKNQVVANHVEAIDAIRTNRVQQYADGGYTSGAGGTGDDLTTVLKELLRTQDRLNTQISRGLGINIGDKNLQDIKTETDKLDRFR